MAIPDNYIDRITDIDYGDRRYICPAADKVRVDNDNFEGTDLDEVLDEIADAIDDAGSGGYAPPAGGIPATDLSSDVQTSLGKADSAYQKPASGIPATDIASGVIPDVSGLATKTELQQGLADKVDKVTGYGLSKNDYTDEDRAAVGTIGSKANAADIPEKVSDLENDEGYLAAEDFKTINNQSIVGSGNISIPKGDKGDTGNCTITDAGQMVSEIVNDLTTGGADKFLSAEMGKRLKSKINEVYGALQSVYAALAGMAFTDGKSPATLPDLDWSIPKHQVVVSLNLKNATVMNGSSQVYNGQSIQVEEGATLTLKVVPDAGCYLDSNSVSAVGGTVVGDEVSIVMGSASTTLSISATATLYLNVSIKKVTAGGIVTIVQNRQTAYTDMVLANDNTVASLEGSFENGEYNGIVQPANGYGIYTVEVMSGTTNITDTAYNPVSREIHIANVSDTISVEIVAMATTDGVFNNVSFYGQGIEDTVDTPTLSHIGKLIQDEGWCCTPDFIKKPNGATLMRIVHNANFPSNQTEPMVWVRRCTMAYTATGLMTPEGFITIWQANTSQREISDLTTVSMSNIKYYRASFPKSVLANCKIQFKVGDAWVDGWVGTEPHIPNS